MGDAFDVVRVAGDVRDVVISLCDRTGNAVVPWVADGCAAILIDLQHDGITCDAFDVVRVGGDVRDVVHEVGLLQDGGAFSLAFAFAFPPCTDLASSGRAAFRSKGLRRVAAAMDLVGVCAEFCERCGCPWLLENPVGTLSTYWRDPDFMFDPCEFGAYLDPPGDAYTKRTCLWTGGAFVMPERRPVMPVLGSLAHTSSGADVRSITPAGFSVAVWEANRVRSRSCVTPA